MAVADLPSTWRKRAGELRDYSDVAARAFERAAAELDTELSTWLDAPLTLAQAKQESGYSVSQLERMLSEEKIPNAGEPRAPRILRRNLPRKPGFGIVRPEQVAEQNGIVPMSRRQAARAIASGE